MHLIILVGTRESVRASLAAIQHGHNGALKTALLQRSSPEFRKDYSFNDERRFVENFGVLERVWSEDARDSRIGANSKRTSGRTQTKEKPCVSPALLKYVLPNTAFMRLADLSQDLPLYSETVELIPMEGPH